MAYIASDILRLLDITDINDPKVITTVNTKSAIAVSDVADSGSYAYVGNVSIGVGDAAVHDGWVYFAGGGLGRVPAHCGDGAAVDDPPRLSAGLGPLRAVPNPFRSRTSVCWSAGRRGALKRESDHSLSDRASRDGAPLAVGEMRSEEGPVTRPSLSAIEA